MDYSRFTIQHYRSFQDEQTLQLAQPVDGKIGSGITFIVGENNSGKTTLVEGLVLRQGKKIKDRKNMRVLNQSLHYMIMLGQK